MSKPTEQEQLCDNKLEILEKQINFLVYILSNLSRKKNTESYQEEKTHLLQKTKL